MHRLRKVVLVSSDRWENSQKLKMVRGVVRRAISNTLISFAGQLITSTTTLLLTMAYGYFLGDAKFGELYFATSFVFLIGTPIERGFNQQITRAVAQEPEEALRYASSTLVIKIVLWLMLYGLMLLVSWQLGYNGEERVLITICGGVLLFTAVTNIYSALHYARGCVVFPVLGTILEKGMGACLGFCLLRSGAGVQAIAFVLLLGALTNALWQALWFYRLLGLGFVYEWELIRKLIRTSIPFLVYGTLSVIYYRIDTFLLSLMTNSAVVGWYGGAYRLFDALVVIPNLVISNIMFPIFAKFALVSKEDVKQAIEKSTNFLLICGLPITMGLLVAAPAIVQFLYPRPEFLHAVPALRALAPGLVFLYMNMVTAAVLVSSRQERKLTGLATLALIFNVVLNLMLIPRYQHTGAALVTSLTELLLLCSSLVLLPRELRPIKSVPVAWKAAGASLIMAAVLWLPMSAWSKFLPLPLIILAGAFIYSVTVLMLRTIPLSDWQILARMFKKQWQDE